MIGYLLLVLALCHSQIFATGDQSMVNLTVRSPGTGLGNAAPAIAYNSNTNEYLLIYSDYGASCAPGEEQLFGIFINAITGSFVGNAIPISDCTNSIRGQKILYNPDLNEYFIFYKSIGTIGNKSNLYYCTINGTAKAIEHAPSQLTGDAIADPFRDFAIRYDHRSKVYALGYHKSNALGETSFTVDYVDGNSKSKRPYQTFIDKDDFSGTNKGVLESKIVFNGSDFILIFELNFDTGSEIWGGIFDPSSGTLDNDYFRISPSGTSSLFYSNPDAVYNISSHEVIIAYEESYYRDGNNAYTLSGNVRLQKINPTNGVLIGPLNVAISPLPGNGNTEDKKLPSILLSTASGEILMSFYGIRFAAGTDLYHLMLHRINPDDLTSISTTSTLVDASVGMEVLENSQLKNLSSAHNSENNQFNLVWISESAMEVKSQIWRYDNNPPGIPSLSSSTINEELPIGYTVSSLSASDPDPEDNSLSFSLVPGGEDNAYFQIDGNALKIAKRLNFEEAHTRHIIIRATDNHGAASENNFAIAINDVDEDPFNLALSGSLVFEENIPSAVFNSTISVQDDDIGNSHTYTLVAGDSSDNNSNFKIEAGSETLELTGAFNFEDTSRQYVRVRATDNTGLSTEKAFTISITDVNEAPEEIILSTNQLPENDTESAAIVDVIDPDNYSNYSFSKSAGEGDDDNEFFNLVDNQLKPATPLNFEAKNRYTVRLRAFDGTYDKTRSFTIAVSDENDNPDSIRLSEHRFLADQPNGSLVGHLVAYDQDAEDSHTFSLIVGADLFFINGTEIRALNSMPYDFSDPANNIHSIVVRATDAQGGAKTESLDIEVVLVKDDEKPEIRNFNEIERHLDSESDSLFLSVDVRDNEQLGSVHFFYRPIRSGNEFINGAEFLFTTIFDQKNSNVVAALSASVMDEMGIEYYFKAIDAAGNADSTNVGYTYWSFAPKQFNAVNTNDYKGTASSYKIITNPYLIESSKVSKIFSDYGASSSNSWRLFGYDAGENREVGNVYGSTLSQGEGYWFNKSEGLDQQIQFELARVREHNRENPFKINLKKGWNLIGNPYPFRLNWDMVNIENEDQAYNLDLFTFDESYSEAHYLNEFQGGFVFADEAVTLDIPVIEASGSGARTAEQATSGNGWMLDFTLESGRIRHALSGIGMHEHADASYDRFDRPLLPRFIRFLDISFDHPEHFARHFSKDIVAIRDNHIWEFVVSSNLPDKNITLSWNSELFKESDHQLILYDVLNDHIINVAGMSEYAFQLDNNATFKAVYGNRSFIRETLSNIKIEALKPYPNPFNEQVTIPINLPYSNNSYDLECSLFNLMGQRVFARKYEKLQPGSFQIELDERSHRNLEQGIYIYSIKVKNGLMTKDFHGRIVKN
ncbi:MAG: cadherin domain-containing protein [Cytophagales bacterium]|nr:cadherin domain-containing protein [Cytophagales bacterium]